MSFELKTDDTRVLDVTPLADGATISAPGASAVFSMVDRSTGQVIINRAAALVLQDTPLKLRFQWSAGQTAAPGTYGYEFRVTLSGGVVMTFPSSGYMPLLIDADI